MNELSQQIADPQHVHIKIGNRFVSHSDTYVTIDDGVLWHKGHPIRFTKLAAGNYINERPWLKGAVLVPA